MLLDVEDWAGALSAVCYECALQEQAFSGTAKEFHRALKRQWMVRKAALGYQVGAKADMNWTLVQKMFKVRYPGHEQAHYRSLMKCYLKTFALVVAADLTSTPQTKLCAQAIEQQHTQQLLWQAANPTGVLPHAGWTLSAAEAQYLIRVTEHLIVSFVCRECGYFGADWIEAQGRYHFRCPYCGLWYRPWKGAREFNKICVLQHPATNGLLYLPMQWSPTVDDNWLMCQAEMYARDVHVPANCDSFLAKQTVALATLLDTAGTPVYFEDFKLSGPAKSRCVPPQWPPETYARHEMMGFRGARYVPDPSRPVHIFKDMDKLIALLGNMIAGKKVFELSQLSNL